MKWNKFLFLSQVALWLLGFVAVSCQKEDNTTMDLVKSQTTRSSDPHSFTASQVGDLKSWINNLTDEQKNDMGELTISGPAKFSEFNDLVDIQSITSLDISGVLLYDDYDTNPKTYIERDFLKGFKSRAKVTLPSNIESIKEDVFSESQIIDIIFPTVIKKLSGGAFSRCENLQNIIIPEGVTEIGNYVFSGCNNLKTISVPSTLTEGGFALAQNCSNLNSIFWNTKMTLPPLNTSVGHERDIVWIYLPIEADSKEECNHPLVKAFKNADGTYSVDSLELRTWINFKFPTRELTVKHITFGLTCYRNYNSTYSSGWFTLSLPFKVTKIQVEDDNVVRDITPFNSEKIAEGAKPFWLRKLTSEGFVDVTSIEPNVPYIVAMPCSEEYYSPEYNISGFVTFRGENAIIKSVDLSEYKIEGPDFVMYPNYDEIPSSTRIYNIDRDSYYDDFYEINYPSGTVFRKNIRDTERYEAYVMDKGVTRSTMFIHNVQSKTTRAVRSGDKTPCITDL